MPREIVTIQVGQCGNQIGRSFWSRALHEHAENAKFDGDSRPVFSEAMSTFFRNVNMSTKGEMYAGSEICDLKARACLIDMEDGVLAETMRGPLRGELGADDKNYHTRFQTRPNPLPSPIPPPKNPPPPHQIYPPPPQTKL
jgi:hypothetical protein